MTHPAFHSVQDTIEAIDAALETAKLSIIQRQILRDLRNDLGGASEIDTFADVVELAKTEAARRFY
ncbi:hypothetical protein [Oceaniglobus trochenteri]|uniref:hypothetical protein n=1 Tax=Oceaniglobus trochenteri TaxID=2763260 RepID=UPI001CFFEC91|nr:hypothetical protein [Oceaniglobus trochenteri]